MSERGRLWRSKKDPSRIIEVVTDDPTGVTYRYVRSGKHRRTSKLDPITFIQRFSPVPAARPASEGRDG